MGRADHNRRQKDKPRLPDWYPLATYAGELSDDEWVAEVWMRLGFKAAYENHAAHKRGRITFANGSTAEDTFVAMIRRDGERPQFISKDEIDYASAWPVRAMTVFEAAFLTYLDHYKMSPDEKLWSKRLGQDPAKWLGRFFRSDAHKRVLEGEKAYAGNYPDSDLDSRGDTHFEVVGPRLPLMVNVNLDDETLKLAFSVWLAGLRAGSKEQKVPFSDKDTADWKKFGVLQAFDLSMWNRMTNAGYTDAFIAQAIWPDDEFVDRTDRYRKVTKPKVGRLFTVWEAERLTHQVALAKFLDQIVERKKANGGTENR